MERAISSILREAKKRGKTLTEVKLICNIDGLPIVNSGTKNFWLILYSEINCEKIYPIVVFCGRKKPENANEFLQLFVDESIALCSNGISNKNVKIPIEAMICDAPAKSFVFSIKGHTGYNSCSKCLIEGIAVLHIMPARGKQKKKRVCFPSVGPFILKTDEDFINGAYENSELPTILRNILGFGCISSVPLDYLHLILLGVMKKLISLWINGSAKVRHSPSQIKTICQRLLILRQSIPSEFNRKPRTLLEYNFWKGTEFRTFLLYSGPVVLKNILPSAMYSNFLLLHSAVSILTSEIHLHDLRNVDSAHKMLENVVQNFALIYGPENVSHNIHNLLHICNDVRKHGVLDNFSAFCFENYMSTVKKMIRKGDKPLQQVARRYSEMEFADEKCTSLPECTFKSAHNDGLLMDDCINIRNQFKEAVRENHSINCTNHKDNCVLLNDGSFAIIENIVKTKSEVRLVGRKLKSKGNLYDSPDSRSINIHVTEEPTDTLFS